MEVAPLRVLIAEDDPAHAEAIRREMGKAGGAFEIRVAGTLREFRELVAGDPPDMALMDLNLPDGRAIEVLTSPPVSGPFPVLIMTSYGSEQAAVEAMKAGALDYFVKSPDSFSDLPRILGRAEREWRLLQSNRRAERDLEESEAKMRSILDNIGIGVSLISRKMEILELNRRMRAWFPTIESDQRPICYQAFNDPPREAACDYCPTCRTLRDGLVHEATTQTPQAGVVRNYRIISSPIFNAAGEVSAAIEMVEDITERLSLESQLRQAQKMEAVGRLAGGVAHDFNNMLGVILGYTDLALRRLNAQEPLYQDLQEVHNAARRSADLTRQLLAFSRKQIVTPRVINLNEAVTLQQKMLGRLIGEDIDLKFIPGPDLWNIQLDPSQVDQVLANLAVNARDAIAGVGSITIETANVTLDESYIQRHRYATPGDYVLLAVSDSGRGMNGEILERIFEPFFTTKAEGQGTGLGLSTVYGIVKQNEGTIQAYSEPGRGTTLKIYFPRFSGEASPLEPVKEMPLAGSETVLIVEDEPQILLLAKRILEHYGYITIGAGSPGEALLLLEKHRGPLDLLLTDVIMPAMTGPDLKARVEALHPGIKTVFMSGYTAEVIAQRGLLDEGRAFVQKPFTVEGLMRKVRGVLDS
jgi:signal transduction histidine kinase/DNA-binding response OmpR family regulator